MPRSLSSRSRRPFRLLAHSPLWLFAVGLVVIPALGTEPAGAAEGPFGVALMRPDSLIGWEYFPDPVKGWRVEDGVLHGGAGASPLLSGFSFGDFELRFRWAVGDRGQLCLHLPDVPQGAGLRLTLSEDTTCGQLDEHGKVLAEGSRPADSSLGRMHAAVVRRQRSALSIKIDGRKPAEVEVDPRRRFGLGLSIQGGAAQVSDLRAAEPAGEPIFNGRDLDGWWCPGKLSAWQAEDGELVLKPGGGNYLRTKKDFGNYTLSLDYLMVKRGNSGIGIRTPQQAWPSVDGMELQLEDREGIDKHKTMAIYGNLPPIARADLSEQWNRVVVKCDGRMITAWVNGQLVQHGNTAHHVELKHRHLAGWIGFQDHGGWIRLRNIRVLEAPEGEGLDVWNRPRALCAGALMIDRLMNPERLSVPDGVEARTVVAEVPGAPKQGDGCVLADLRGPGAVVRVARSSDQGRLAFYFDGESKPRLECRPPELWRAAPTFTEYRGPVLTCLAYEKRLKVVLQGADRARYAIDYVTLPNALPVETFVSDASGLPRGWLSAILFRVVRARWGTVREHDPLPRHDGPNTTIEPGRREPLIHLDGAGVVEWLKLKAPKHVLEDQDLWIEVTVDGQSEPALAAPARFLYPGLAGQNNFSNFVMLNRGGSYFLLAMPFGNGITVAARNAGKRPISGVGATLGVRPSDQVGPVGVDARMRLRGEFLPAGEKTDVLADLEGPGRWVGLVCENGDGRGPAIASVVLDGRAEADGHGLPADLFLGQSGPFRGALSGRNGPLAWRYLIPEAVDFARSLEVGSSGDPGARLVLYYARP